MVQSCVPTQNFPNSFFQVCRSWMNFCRQMTRTRSTERTFFGVDHVVRWHRAHPAFGSVTNFGFHTLGRLHSSEVAFALLTQWSRVRILVLPRLFQLRRFFSTSQIVNRRDLTHLVLKAGDFAYAVHRESLSLQLFASRGHCSSVSQVAWIKVLH